MESDVESPLEPLADFLPLIEAPDFDFGHWVPGERPAPAVVTMPYYAFSPQGLALIAAMPSLPDFDWSEWHKTTDGQAMLNDRSRLANASVDDLTKLTTTLLRGDHFTDGTLANAYASGLLRAIVERASELVKPAM